MFFYNLMRKRFLWYFFVAQTAQRSPNLTDLRFSIWLSSCLLLLNRAICWKSSNDKTNFDFHSSFITIHLSNESKLPCSTFRFQEFRMIEINWSSNLEIRSMQFRNEWTGCLVLIGFIVTKNKKVRWLNNMSQFYMDHGLWPSSVANVRTEFLHCYNSASVFYFKR